MDFPWLNSMKSEEVKNLHIALIAVIVIALIVSSNWMTTQISTVDFLKNYYNSKVVWTIINVCTILVLLVLFYHATETKSQHLQMIYGGLLLLLVYVKYLYYTNNVSPSDQGTKQYSQELFLGTMFRGLALGVGLTQLALD
jgi:cell division protein FtsW (lipid II flippase)